MKRKRLIKVVFGIVAILFLALAGIGAAISIADISRGKSVSDCERQAIGSVVEAFAHEGFTVNPEFHTQKGVETHTDGN